MRIHADPDPQPCGLPLIGSGTNHWFPSQYHAKNVITHVLRSGTGRFLTVSLRYPILQKSNLGPIFFVGHIWKQSKMPQSVQPHTATFNWRGCHNICPYPLCSPPLHLLCLLSPIPFCLKNLANHLITGLNDLLHLSLYTLLVPIHLVDTGF